MTNTRILLTGVAIMSMAGSATAATVSLAGSDLNVSAPAPGGGDYWRTTAVVKPNDIDGDNVLGTDGYRYVRRGANPDIQSSAPSYLDYNLTGSHFGGNTSYAVIDSGTAAPGAPGNQRSGTFNPTAAPNNAEGAWVSFGTIDFTVAATPSTSTVRLGLMVDNLDNIIFNSHFLRLSHNGSNFDVATTAESGTDNKNPDWYYWDISNFAIGDSIEIFATSSEGNPAGTTFPATIGAFSFDSVVPEPSSITLIGLSGLALLGRRRR